MEYRFAEQQEALRGATDPEGPPVTVWGSYNPPNSKTVEGESKDSVSDPVDHPRHYNVHPSGVECITVTKHMNFCLGNAMKYIWRAGEKGDAIEDLKKAIWYCQCEIDRLQGIK